MSNLGERQGADPDSTGAELEVVEAEEIDSDPSYTEDGPYHGGRRAPRRSDRPPDTSAATTALVLGSRRTTRVNSGIAPSRLETTEIQPYGAQAKEAKVTAAKKKTISKPLEVDKFRAGSKSPHAPSIKSEWEDVMLEMIMEVVDLVQGNRSMGAASSRRYPAQGIPTEYLDLSRLPDDVLLSTARKAVQPGAWAETVIRVHGFFQRLFRRPISAACLRTVISTYHGTDDEPEYHFGPNPTDALQFVQALLPGCTWESASAVIFLDNLVRYSHYYQFYCPDFVHRFFHHNMILGVVGFWISDFMLRSYLPSRVPAFASTPEEYRAQVVNILRIARSQAAEGYMPLARMLFDSDNTLALIHLGAHSPKLLRMFPLYLEQSRIVKIQMYLAYVYHSRPEQDLYFYILMTTFGGIYRGAVGYGETIPDDLEPTDIHGLYECYEFRDHIQLPSDDILGIPLEPWVTLPEVEQIRAWYAEEQVAYYHNCAETSSVTRFQRTEELREILFRAAPTTIGAEPTSEGGSATAADSHQSSPSRKPRPRQKQVVGDRLASAVIPATLLRFETGGLATTGSPVNRRKKKDSSPPTSSSDSIPHKRSRKAGQESDDVDHSSSSESSCQGIRSFKDSGQRVVNKYSSKSSTIIRQSDALRTLTPKSHLDRIHQKSGLIWFHQRSYNPSIAFKVFMFCWSLSRNWQWDSLRLFHFLPTKRAQELARDKFKGTYSDFLDAIRGLAATYRVAYGKAYGDAFLEMVNRAYAQQAGVSYSWDFLESTFNDLLHRFYEAARNPLVRTHLPGRRHTCKPIKLIPDQWGAALIDAFQALITEFRHPSVFQDTREAKPEKPINPKGELDRNGKPIGVTPTPRVVAKVDPPDFSKMMCYKSFLHHYKIPSHKGEVPAKAITISSTFSGIQPNLCAHIIHSFDPSALTDADHTALTLTNDRVAFHLAGMPFIFQVVTRMLTALVTFVILGLCMMYVDDLLAVSILSTVDRDMAQADEAITLLLAMVGTVAVPNSSDAAGEFRRTLREGAHKLLRDSVSDTSQGSFQIA
ncbi:hypothetical protein B484DRAFT_395444 [Ochromonadaceae sp. CCMP2298]|nr:hypothetical protein B484DRAFT_395444 [Ochromonadaceae sp. CCMP2298]